MIPSIFKKRKVAHAYLIEYDIMINGERYPRQLQFPGYSKEDALERFAEQRRKTNDLAEYHIKNTTEIR